MLYLSFIKCVFTAAGFLGFTGLYFHIHHSSVNTDGFTDDIQQNNGKHASDVIDQLYSTYKHNELPSENGGEKFKVFPEDLKKILENKYPRFLFCEICKNLVALINNHISINYTFNEFQSPAEGICHKVCDIIGLNNEICTGIVKAYGPPVLYIAKQLLLDPQPLCEKLSFCLPKTILHTDNLLLQVKDGPRSTTRYKEIQNTPTPTNQKKKPIKILQISDIHVDKQYKPGSASKCSLVLCCHDNDTGTGSAGQFGDYNCDIPWQTVDVLVDSIKEMESSPDFIVYTGDSPPHDVWKESWLSQYSVDKDVVDYLKDRFDGISVYPTLGNHETFPANLYYSKLPEYQYFNEKNVELWNQLFSIPASQRDNIIEDAYYQVLIRPGLRLISFNSNHGYTYNFYALLNHKNPDQERQRSFMEKTLHDARKNGEKVIMIGHIPPGDVPNTYQSYGDFYTTLVTNYQDVIVLQLFGHTHRDQYQLVIPNQKKPQASGVVFIAPSVTTFPNQNPTYRIYTLDPDSYQLLDYQQYYLNISKANAEGKATVELMYSAKEEYNLHDMSPQSFLGLSQRMSTDMNVFNSYWNNRHARSSVKEDCDNACRDITICETLSATFNNWVNCVGRISVV